MKLSVFFALVAYACATTFSPGPNNVLLLSSTGQYGFKKCFPLMRGIWTGLITVMLICGFGCKLLGDLIPAIETYARFVGAAYILWLGYKTLTRRAVKDPSSSEDQEKPLTFVNGFLLQFLNVKILMLGIAAYCSFVLPYGTSVPATLIFAVTMAACAATGNLIWATVGSLLFPVYNKHYRLFNGIMALLLFWCVYKILFI
ncbi:MAG: LysE family transporter [bacterium]|nr:LysE family transporter [bacterium]MDY4098795.1 LysE family transporter [Lachnospiraceae bacterium]